MSKWQTIDTAPDDLAILATWSDTWKEKNAGVHVEAMRKYGPYWSYVYDGDSPERPPTHWMPLPDPPTKSAS
jgi:hypothetical protein